MSSRLLSNPCFAIVLVAITSSPAHSAWAPCGVSPASSSAQQVSPAIAVDPSLGVLIAWNEEREGYPPFVSFAQRLTSDGNRAPGWPGQGLALPGPTHPTWDWPGRDNLAMLPDGAGGMFVIDGCMGNQGLTQLRRITTDGAAPAWPAGGVTISAFAVSAAPARDRDYETPHGIGPGDTFPVLEPDGDGGVLVAWQYVSRSAEHLYVQRITSTGAPSPGWPSLGRMIAPSSSLPSMCSDGAGGALVAFTSYEPVPHVLVQHLRADGTIDPLWPAGGRRLSSFSGHQTSPVLVSDAAGGCFVSWQDPRGGTDQTFVQRLHADGTIADGWPADGKAVSVHPTEAAAAVSHRYYEYRLAHGSIVSDGAGGAIVAWRDFRAGANEPDLYAQRILASGQIAPGWPINGAPICSEIGEHTALRIASDGNQGAYFVWEDWRDGDADIYAQHLTSSGTPADRWPSAGLHVCAAAGDQHSPAVAVDAVSLLAAWVDGSMSPTRVVTTRVHPDVILGVDVPPGARLALGAPYPNPTGGVDLVVPFVIPARAPVRLEIFDLAGRLIDARDISDPNPGLAQWKPGSRLRPGIYHLRAMQGASSATRRIAVTQ